MTEAPAPARTHIVAGSDTPRHAARVATVEADDEAVLLDEVNDQVHLLNPMAALVWACLDGSGSLTDLAFDLADEFGAPFEQVLADVLAIVQKFADDGLAEFEPAVEAVDESPEVALADEADPVSRPPVVLPEPPSP